jgi:peptidoglycan hydrolase CwlO-like protein
MNLPKTKTILLISILITAFLSYVKIAQGQTVTPTPTPDKSAKVKDLQNQISEYQAKISELQGQSKTLSSQISVMDNQIKLTSLKIQSIEQQILDLGLDIDTTDKKINKLENSLDNLTATLINKIKATYIAGNVSSFQTLISSSNLTDFAKKSNYLKIAQARDKRLLYDTVQAKNDYSKQKEIFVDKKSKVEELKAELEGYTKQLAKDKADKDALLAVTKNDEAIYQQRLQQALAEQRAIAGITSGGGNEVAQGPINQGDVVGYMISGASACSSGTHLHFEVKNNGTRDNPGNYLSNRSVNWNNSPDGTFSFNGSWSWPLNDTITIHQGYGYTAWSNAYYGGGPHTGIDMSSSSSRAVLAVKGGNLYKGSIACGGGQLPFSRVDHDDGTQTYYLHIN